MIFYYNFILGTTNSSQYQHIHCHIQIVKYWFGNSSCGWSCINCIIL